MKLEKCALCDAKPNHRGDWVITCKTRACPMPAMARAIDWNRLQRAIRKAKRGGKVLTRGRACLQGQWWLLCSDAELRDSGGGCEKRGSYCRRVEVREVKG